MNNLVEINDLFVEYETKTEVFKPAKHVYAVNGVNLNIKKGSKIIPTATPFILLLTKSNS